jgi:cellulose 1,4-beta-cellobiosidase
MLKFLLLSLITLIAAQRPGTLKRNDLLPLPIKVSGATLNTVTTIDQNWRWVHKKDGYENCFDNGWNSALCPSPLKCIDNCLLEGVPLDDYVKVYGVGVKDSGLTLKYVKGSNVGSRMYLLAPDKKSYYPFNLNNREFRFTVDTSTLPCGTNGAVYFVDIPLDGGLSTTNTAGAPFGTGYGDAQGARDLKYVNGLANLNNTGNFAIEFDIWEANSMSNQIAAHPCSIKRTRACNSDTECGPNSFCDKPGADLNPYRLGFRDLYGPGKLVDTKKPFTVVTQFITHNNSDSGVLSKIQRYYVQEGKVIDGGFMTDSTAEKSAADFKDAFRFKELGGLANIGAAFRRGLTLVLSLWDDATANMLWLDSTYPVGSTQKGAARGPCPAGSGVPSETRQKYGDSAYVIYSDIQVQRITAPSTPAPSTPAPSTPAPSTPAQCVPLYGQCGGQRWNLTTCCAPATCVFSSPYYSQCLVQSGQTYTCKCPCAC